MNLNKMIQRLVILTNEQSYCDWNILKIWGKEIDGRMYDWQIELENKYTKNRIVLDL